MPHLPPLSSLTANPDRRRWLSLVVVCLAQLMIVLDTTIVNVALPSIQHDLHFTQGNLYLGHRRVPGHVRQLPAAGRTTRRSPRSQARLPVRPGHLHRRVGAVRGRAIPGVPDRRSLPPGHRCRVPSVGDPRDHRHRVPQAGRSLSRDERVRVRVGRGWLARPAGRRRAHRGTQLALDLLRQRSDRSRHAGARQGAGPIGPRLGARARDRLARLGPRHRCADDRRLCDRRGDQPRAGPRLRCSASAPCRSCCSAHSWRSSHGWRTRSCRCGSCPCAGSSPRASCGGFS